MTLTLLPINKPRLKADTRALRNVKIETTRKLEMEVRATAREEERNRKQWWVRD
jgi:hypothetical protein